MTDLTHIKRALRPWPPYASGPTAGVMEAALPQSLRALPASNWFTESAAGPEAIPYRDDSEKWRDYLTKTK